MPISFKIKEDGRFDIGGIQKESNRGAVISGNIAGDITKINHIFTDEELRGMGIGKALLAKLEEQLEKQGIKIIFPTFEKPETVEFFLHSGYRIIPVESLMEEEKRSLDIDAGAFDERVRCEDDFIALKGKEETRFKKILLIKEIGKK